MHKEKILLIDSARALGESILFTLRDEAYPVVHVSTTIEGIRQLSFEKYDIIIIDLSYTARECLRFIKNIRKFTQS
ncbi:MAG: hypothetical protein ACLFR1_08340, partial [Spirochaetia bacterium]